MNNINETSNRNEMNNTVANNTVANNETLNALAALGKSWQKKVADLRKEIGRDMGKVVAALPAGCMRFSEPMAFGFQTQFDPDGQTDIIKGFKVSDTGMPYFIGWSSANEDSFINSYPLAQIFRLLACVPYFASLMEECRKKADAVRAQILAELKGLLETMGNKEFEEIYEDWCLPDDCGEFERLAPLCIRLDADGNVCGEFSDTKGNEKELPLTEFEADEIADRFAVLDWTPVCAQIKDSVN